MPKPHLYTLEEAAKLLDVEPTTIIKWQEEGKIKTVESFPNKDNKKFAISELLGTDKASMITVGYARISANQSDYDLARQIAILKVYFEEQGWDYKIIQDVGKKGNFRHPGLIRLLKLICSNQIQRLVLTNKNKLLGLGSDFVLILCEVFNTQVVILNSLEEDYVQEEISEDLTGIINLFKCRMGENPNREKEKLLQELKTIARDLKLD